MNYFESIEQNFSKIRRQHSRLNPIDWQRCADWEKRIPLHIVLNAMDEVAKKFGETKRPDKINSLSYFKQAVEKSAAEYAAAQIGKAPEENTMNIGIDPAVPGSKKSVMVKICESGADYLEENLEILRCLKSAYANNHTLPKSIRIATGAVAKDLEDLIVEVEKHCDLGTIETRLEEMSNSLIYPLAQSLTDAERTAMIAEIESENKHRTLNNDSRAKIATKKLYQKYNLPELTLFEF